MTDHVRAVRAGATPEYMTIRADSHGHVHDAVAVLHASGGWSIVDEDGLTVRRMKDSDAFEAILWRPKQRANE